MTQSIIFCDCPNKSVIPTEIRNQILSELQSSETEQPVIVNLCEWAMGKGIDPFAALPGDANLRLYGCHSRAMRWLLERGGYPLADKAVEFIDLRAMATEIPGNMVSIETMDKAGLIRHIQTSPDPGAWYPVIDYDRCRNCKQCLSFCLFGVYTLDSTGKVVVHQPANCKPNCPACARICPETAIIFPKYSEPPINGGTAKETFAAEKTNEPVEAINESDIYSALAERKRRAVNPLLDREKVNKLSGMD